MGKLQSKLIILFISILFANNVLAKGFTIDLRENNPTLQDQFEKFELTFNFEKKIVIESVKVANKYRRNVSHFSEIAKVYNISKIDDNGLTFEMSYRQMLDWAHKTHLDDDWLVGSKYYNKKFKSLVEESGGLDAPYTRIEFNINDLTYSETQNPLTKKPKIFRSSFAYDPEAVRKKQNTEKFVKAALFVVTVALVINHIDEINKIKEVNSSTSKTQSLTSSNGYSPRWAKPGYKFNSSQQGQKDIAEYLIWKFRRF